MELPKLKVKLALPDPQWTEEYGADDAVVNMNSYYKEIEVEVEVVQLNLNAKTMRVRFPWPSKHLKKSVGVMSRDISIEHFLNKYQIVEK